MIANFFSFTLTSISDAQVGVTGMPGWSVVLIVLAVTLLVALLLIWNASLAQGAMLPAAGHSSEVAADDLKLIEGIGPKIAGLLQMKGISTFTQLAETEPARLERILKESGLRIADPTTWPDQARLAAAHNWEALDQLQKDLKGGRRV
jgi:hypothetical protein